MRWLLLVLALPLVLSACRDSGGTGTYHLATVGRAPLPAVLTQDARGRLELASGDLTLNPDSTFRITLRIQSVVGSTATPDATEQAGTYIRRGDSLDLVYGTGAKEVATISGKTITLNSAGFVLGFER